MGVLSGVCVIFAYVCLVMLIIVERFCSHVWGVWGETCEDLRKESVLHVVFSDSKSERLLTLTNTLTTRRSTLVYGIG